MSAARARTAAATGIALDNTVLIVAGTLFIIPAMLSVLGFAWLYVTYGSLPQVDWLLYGIKPVIIAVVGQALWKLGRDSLKSILLIAVAVAAIGLFAAGSIFVVFALVLWRAVARGAAVSCHCFGATKDTVSVRHVARTCALAVLAYAAGRARRGRVPLLCVI